LTATTDFDKIDKIYSNRKNDEKREKMKGLYNYEH